MTTAATLQILVEASTRTASMQLSKLDRQLKGVDKTTATATTRTSNLGRATSSVGSSLGRAARAAGAAAIAYLSISQAKAAVTTTQELAKSTIGLHKNLGIANKTAGEWSAAARARGVDTMKLGMGFKTLSSQVEAARHGTASASKLFKQLGIDERELAEGSKDVAGLMLQIADGTEKAGSGTARLNTISKLFGRSYQGLAPLIRGGREELELALEATEKYGSVLHGKALKEQEALRNETIESTLAWQGLQVTFTKMVTPALMEAHDQFQRISRIMASTSLTDEERFKRVGQIIGKWSDKAFDLFIGILPKMAEKAAEQAPKIASALAQGFINADIWGKLFAGAWLLTKLGGLAMFRTTGQTAGKTFGRGMAIGLALAMPFLIKEAFDWGTKIGPTVRQAGADLGEWLVNGMIDVVNVGIRTINDAFDKLNVLGKFGVDAPELGEIGKVDFTGPVEAAKEAAKATRETWRKGWQDVQEIHERGGQLTNKTSARLWSHYVKSTEDASGRGEKAAAGNSADMARKVAGNVFGMVDAVGSGYKTLSENTNKALRAFGVDPQNFTIKKLAKGASELTGPGIFRNRGGDVPGTGNTDSVPAMLTPGEFVINKQATAMTRPLLEAINNGFAQGGVVGGLQPGISRLAGYARDKLGLTVSSGLRAGSGSLHNTGEAVDLVPPSMSATKALFGAFKNQLAELFYDPWGGWNDGQMIGAIGGHMDHIHAAILGGGAGGPAGVKKLAKLVLKGPKGPLRDMGQSGLDRAWSAANKYLSTHAMTQHGDVGGFSSDGPVQRVFAQVAKKLSSSRIATLALGMAGFAESGMKDLSYGDSSSQGALQLLASTASGMGINPHDEGAIASAFLLRGFYGRGGANKLAASGLPAHLVAQGVQGSAFSSGSNYLAQKSAAEGWMRAYGLKAGGYVGSFAQGGTVPRDGMARVHRGETITPAGSPHVVIQLHGSMDAVLDEVDVLIDGRKADIAEYTIREGGRNRARSRQLAGQAGRA